MKKYSTVYCKAIKYAAPRWFGQPGVSYETLNNYLGKRSSRRLAANKVIHKDADDNIHVQLHNTDVVSAHPDGTYTVRTGGWHTPTTRRTIAYITGLPVHSAGKDASTINGTPLEEGMRLGVKQEKTPVYKNDIPLEQQSEYQQLQAAIHENPKESTGHLAAADWLAEHGYPEEEDFRRKMAEWVTRPEEDHFSGGGNGSFGLHRLKTPLYPFLITVHHKNLPEWAAKGVKEASRKFNHANLETNDPAISSSPVGVNHNWRSYKDMEEGLRRAHREHFQEQSKK